MHKLRPSLKKSIFKSSQARKAHWRATAEGPLAESFYLALSATVLGQVHK